MAHLGYHHLAINHAYSFVNAFDPSINTNTIERVFIKLQTIFFFNRCGDQWRNLWENMSLRKILTNLFLISYLKINIEINEKDMMLLCKLYPITNFQFHCDYKFMSVQFIYVVQTWLWLKFWNLFKSNL